MKKISLNLKTIRNSILLMFLSLSVTTFAQTNNYVDVEYSSTTNAVNQVKSGSSNGYSTYETHEITIPFTDNSLDKLIFRANFPSACPGNLMINVNGNNSTYAANPNPVLHKWYEIENLPVGIHEFTVKSLCYGSEVPNSRKLIRVKVVRELPPALNLTISAECQKGKDGKNNGRINFVANGSYTNASNLYVNTTVNSNICPNSSIKLVNFTGSNQPNNTVTNSVFYHCNANALYEVKMFYKNTNLRGNPVVRNIASGQYGWNDFSYRKRGWSCTELVVMQPMPAVRFRSSDSLEGSNLSIKNPVSSELNLFVNSGEKMNYDIEIFDFSGMSVKKATLKSADSESINTINVEDLQKGIYIVQIKNGDSVVRKKMIKE